MQSSKFIDEAKTKTIEQLNIELIEAKKELFNLRLKNATNQLSDTSKIGKVRKNIARIETIISIKKKA